MAIYNTKRRLTMRQKSFLLTRLRNFIVVVTYRQAAVGLRIVYNYLAEYIKSSRDVMYEQKEIGITIDRRKLRLWADISINTVGRRLIMHARKGFETSACPQPGGETPVTQRKLLRISSMYS